MSSYEKPDIELVLVETTNVIITSLEDGSEEGDQGKLDNHTF